jgi:DNA-binding MarR family transcriptional regulator
MNPRLKHGFGQVTKTVICDPDITLKEKAIYAYLCTYADSNNSLFVSVKKIAAECGNTESTVIRILKQLEQKGVITRESRGYGITKTTVILK